MPEIPRNQREFGYYVALAQVGVEMAAPIAVGWALDHYLGWTPWGIIGGAVFGLIAGLAHLVALANRPPNGDSSQPRPEGP